MHHLSAGIGRTGCFIVSSIGCQQLREAGQVDILETVCQLRLDRWVATSSVEHCSTTSICSWPPLAYSGGMIQTTEQYQFLYSTLAQYSSQLQHRQVRPLLVMAPVWYPLTRCGKLFEYSYCLFVLRLGLGLGLFCAIHTEFLQVTTRHTEWHSTILFSFNFLTLVKDSAITVLEKCYSITARYYVLALFRLFIVKHLIEANCGLVPSENCFDGQNLSSGTSGFSLWPLTACCSSGSKSTGASQHPVPESKLVKNRKKKNQIWKLQRKERWKEEQQIHSNSTRRMKWTINKFWILSNVGLLRFRKPDFSIHPWIKYINCP